jgi:hypothetical protein
MLNVGGAANVDSSANCGSAHVSLNKKCMQKKKYS